MSCPQCGHENLAGAKFCGKCGARLETLCPACRLSNPPANKFCQECGAPLARAATSDKFGAPESYTPKHLADKILTSKSAIEGERKQVTVLFTDVSGFTAMSERLDPEEVHAIMDRTFAVILEAVHRYEGTVNQFLGDGVMALFGAPIAHEDHPHRSLRAALSIQQKLQPIHDDVHRSHGLEFRVRIGINTGHVVVGAIGRDLRMDYTAVGDTTNLASRLLNLAQPGQIVVSERTRRSAEGFFVFEDLGEFTVKGKGEPVRAYSVAREIRGRTRLEVSRERGLTPLAGRERELGRLQEAYQRAIDGGGAIVVMIGEPGVGKSRLLYEFFRSLEGLEITTLEASCLPHSRSMPYAPILELLRSYLGVSEAMAEEKIRSRIAEELDALGIEDAEGPTLIAHLLGLTAPPEFLARVDGARLKERTSNISREMFFQASEARPLMIVVENVHWLDPSSEEFLKYLAEGLPGHRIILVLSSRPGSWLTPPLAETIRVEGLHANEVRSMTRALFGVEATPELLDLLLLKSAGNPLYVEEIIRQLRDTGVIVIEDGTARLSRADVAVPESIHDIIAARLDRLADALKQTLQVAAVIGRQFWVLLLARVLELQEKLVAGRLESLRGLDFVFPSAQEPFPEYTFKHALTQEVAYTSLLERRRRLYHAAIGLGLEDLYAERRDEIVELLAHHFGLSGEAEKAVDYAILAAEKAQRRWANTEALAFFESALKRLDTMPDIEANRVRKIDAIIKQAEVKFALGRHAEHVKALEAIRDIVEVVADPPRRAAWYYWAGFLHSLTGSRPEISIAYCREAAAIAESAGFDELRAYADCTLTHVYGYAGKLHDALAAGERALPIFEGRGNVWWACRTLWGLNLTAIPLGEWERSLEYCRRALEYGRAVDDRRLKAVGWWRTGWTHIQRGDPETGIRCCDEALALSPSPFDAAMIRAVRGYGLVKVGDIAAGTTVLAESVAWFERSRLPYTRSWYALWLGDSYLRQGEHTRARQIAEETVAESRAGGYRCIEGIAERIVGASLVAEDPVSATHRLEVAQQILEEVGARNEVAKTLVTKAALLRHAGDSAAARRVLENALAIFEELGTLDEPPRVQEMLAALT